MTLNKKIILKNADENGMISVIELNNMKTKVGFGFDPDDVVYLGKLDKTTIEKMIE